MKSLQLHYEVVSMASGLFHVTRMIAAMGAIATSGFTVWSHEYGFRWQTVT